MKYFDYAATAPMCEDAARIYVDMSTRMFGNSSSLHDYGSQADYLLNQCRESMAEMIGGLAEGIYFTSGGTESNILSILSLARKAKNKGKHIITSMAEHSSVHSAMAILEKEGFEITRIAFNQSGLIDLKQLKSSIREDTILVTIQYVNQEIGTIQPAAELGAFLKEKEILFHSDCVQAFGKLDLRPLVAVADSLSLSSHKVRGPKGVGAAYISPTVSWEPVFPGLSHEKGFRGGTVNVPGILAFTAAAEKATRSYSLDHEWKLRSAFKEQLQRSACVFLEADTRHQLPSIIGMRLPGVEGQFVMLEANQEGMAISTGSACQSGVDNGAKATLAMGQTETEAKQFFRVSFGEETTVSDVAALADVLNRMPVIIQR
ncbi:cysteine desulfurase [Bacillus ectoiniformans]|uniref:IscS subfamily cysteine desulfurase n=1 Tax=Bacillus ectoiniformans TaxID=1494429 RepID=UPI001957D6A2|nr:IscS subfamily cysteine desulfurase [Bacillus ectoiniformans]MBM7648964.1 cysteine desulfurase [Bacillus ectoiniformans]